MSLFSGNQLLVDGKVSSTPLAFPDGLRSPIVEEAKLTLVKTVLITGASEGMGLSAAKQLAAKGADVILVSRSGKKLEEALKTVTAAARNASKQRFHYITADVANHSYAQPLLQEAVRWNDGKSIDIVWCVAGMSTPELFIDMEMSSLRRQMDVNFYGTAEMSHAILRDWLSPNAPIEKDAKHLIMTASTAAFYAVAGYGPYSPSKWAMRSLADTISQELRLYPQNVKVHVVFPGSITSPGFERENLTKPLITRQMEESDPEQTPDEVAAAAIKGLEAGQYFITVNILGKLMRWAGLAYSERNNWLLDFLGAALMQIISPFFLVDMYMKTSNHLKLYGHPATVATHKP